MLLSKAFDGSQGLIQRSSLQLYRKLFSFFIWPTLSTRADGTRLRHSLDRAVAIQSSSFTIMYARETDDGRSETYKSYVLAQSTTPLTNFSLALIPTHPFLFQILLELDENARANSNTKYIFWQITSPPALEGRLAEPCGQQVLKRTGLGGFSF